MAQLIIEIHIPLVSTGSPPGTTWPRSTAIIPDDHPCPWIFEVEEYLAEREDDGTFAIYDDGEEFGDHYLYFITGASEEPLLTVAADVATLPGIPQGVFAIVTDDEAEEMGVGRRIPLT
ncbi:hypothetical protein [Kribbella shirazensis]|uniref:Uncharacterized protein n=1 Tax=Kribbella shirazensis TaxID=1105143 RepID=A0A7X5V7F2_9ACTN|nr:hypothetical protein [Kribbella shirazensis]NIK55992.1 hypothetical protein [Kribbella shirazensis]